MSRNKFGELVKKYIVDYSGNAERRVLGHLPGDYVGMNVYEALNVMLNILYEKDGMGIEGAATKVSKIANIYYEQAKEIVLAHKLYKTLSTDDMEKKEVLVTKVKKKVRGHDKYRFFINTSRTSYNDANRVFEEAEKEGYDLVAINNNKTTEPAFIYCTDAVFKLVSKSGINRHPNLQANGGLKGWNLLITKLTITEIFEVIKKAEESKVKVVVERYRVKVKG